MKHAHTQFLPFELDHVPGVTGRNPCKKERLLSRFRLGNVLNQEMKNGPAIKTGSWQAPAQAVKGGAQ